MLGKKGGHLLGNATPLASMAGPVLRQQLSHGAAIGHSRVGWVKKKLAWCSQRMGKLPVEETNSGCNHDKLALASLVQLIDKIGVGTEPGALYINVVGRGR